MNLSYQIRTHFKLCLQSLMGICIATIFISSQAQADGVILIKNHATQSPHFWRVFVFQQSEASSFNYTVTLLNGLKQNFFRSEVGAIIEEPKWDEMIVVTDADWQKLEQQKAQLISSVAQYPQLKGWINKITAKFDELLNSRSSSDVLYRGRLIAKEEFDKLSGNTSSPPSSSTATLTVGGKQFTNVKVLSIKSGRLGFSHDGGMGGVQMSALDAKQTEWVKLTSPALFEAHLKELSMISDKANQPSVSQNKNDDGPSKAMVSKETKEAKANEKSRIFNELLKSHEEEKAKTNRWTLTPELARKNGILLIKGLYIGMPFQNVWPSLKEKYSKKFVLVKTESENYTENQVFYNIVTNETGDLITQGQLSVDPETHTLKSFTLGAGMVVDLFELDESNLSWEEFAQIFIDNYGIPKMEGIADGWSYIGKDFKMTISTYMGLTVTNLSRAAFGD